MSGPEVLVFGEALFDVFVSSSSNPAAPGLEARAGGSPMNVAIGLSRLKCSAALLSQISRDTLGDSLKNLLLGEGVDCSFLNRVERPTTLSLVATGTDGQPDYSFYSQGADSTLDIADLPQVPGSVRVLHFGSYALVAGKTADAAFELARRAKDRIITLDPNIRPGIEPDSQVWINRIDAIAPFVDVVKVSDEDIAALYGANSDPLVQARKFLDVGPKQVYLTRGANPSTVLTKDFEITLPTPATNVIDTVGAGDTFMAMLISQLTDGFGKATESDLSRILARCQRSAALTCSKRGADLPYLHQLD